MSHRIVARISRTVYIRLLALGGVRNQPMALGRKAVQQLGTLGVVVLFALGGYVAARQTTVHEVDPPHALSAGTRVLLDAHNAYVENGGWSDRIDRALATGLPIAIEQDLVWIPASSAAPGRSVVSHGPPVSGSEPTLEEYFFKRIAPLVEEALKEN